MGAPIPALGYSSLTEAAVALDAQGLSPKEIGAELAREPRQICVLLDAARRKARRRTGHARIVALADATVELLRPHAEARNATVGQVAERILEAVTSDGLVDAVLDDGGGAA